MFTRPAFGLAEIAWRWSFAASAWLILAFAVREYLATLPVKARDLFLLRTRQPALISQALLHILRGSSLRLVQTAVLLLLALTVAWVCIASLCRAATLQALRAHFRADGVASSAWFRALPGIHFLRAAALVAALAGTLSAFVLGRAATSAANPSPGFAVLIVLTVMMLVWLAWSLVNWLLSFASVVAVVEGTSTVGAITLSVATVWSRFGPIAAVSTWFGLAHLVIFFVASSGVAFPLAFASVLPFGAVLGGVLLVTLVYFAAADFLYMGRLAAYVAILELPAHEVSVPEVTTPPASPLRASFQQWPSSGIDPDELILSDVPV